jgi:hypothetical protein
LLAPPNIKTAPILALPKSSYYPAILFESIGNWFSLIEQNAAEHSPTIGFTKVVELRDEIDDYFC